MKKLYIQQAVFKITDHYPIVNEHHETVYYVDQKFKLIGKFYTVTDITGKEVFTLERGLTVFLPMYTITFATGETITIRTRFTLFRYKFDIEFENFTLKVDGDFFAHNYALYTERTKLASINKKWVSWGDAYEITIYDETFIDLSVAILIAVDELIDTQRKNSNNS